MIINPIIDLINPNSVLIIEELYLHEFSDIFEIEPNAQASNIIDIS